MIDRLNPAALPASPAFAQGTVATGSRTVYVGGQNGIDATGALADGAQKQSDWPSSPNRPGRVGGDKRNDFYPPGDGAGVRCVSPLLADSERFLVMTTGR